VRAPWAVFAGAIAIFLAAALWPLPDPPVGEVAAPPAIPAIPAVRATVADRESTLASLTKRNIFSANGAFWLAPPEPDAVADNGAPGSGGDRSAPPMPIPVITQSDPIPPDLKPALDNLRLAGVRINPAGVAFAMFVCASDLTTMIQRTAGEEFVDKQNPQAPWRIIDIDTTHDRVTVERSGKRVSLALYANEPIPVVVAPPPAPVPATSPAPKFQIERASEADVVRDLRAAGVDEKDIAALTELLRKDPEAFARAQAEALGAPAQEAPTGIGEVFKFMQQAKESKDAPGANPPTPPPPN